MANLASLLKHRGCQRVGPDPHPPAAAERPQARPDRAGSPLGWGLAAVAWLVHVAALSMAPISLVQAVLAGGAVTLAVMSQRLFGDAVDRRQWLALLLGGAGLALLAVTVPQLQRQPLRVRRRPRSSASREAWRCWRPALALGHRSERLAARRGILLAVLSGTLFALAGVAIKGLTGAERSLASRSSSPGWR